MKLSFLTKPFFILIILLCIGFIIRVYNLSSIPGGFHEDEAHIGYNAYSLLKTAHDKNNVFLPLAIDQFGDFRPAGLHYLTIPSVALFGLNEFATRFPVAVFGSLSILAIYFLSLEIFQRKSIALFTATLLTFNPWSIIASRSTSESIVALFFVMCGTYFVVKVARNAKRWDIILSALFFCISFLFYHAARYFVPLLLVYVTFILLVERKFNRKILIGIFMSFAIVLLFLGFLFKFGSGSGRVQEISIFSFPATKIMLYQQNSEDSNLPSWQRRIFHNTITAYSYTAFVNYFEHFSSDFLFFKGGLPPRYMVPWSGNFYLITGLCFLIGLSLLVSQLLTNRKKETWIVMLAVIWVFLGPVPAAFTFEDIPHFQRSIMMLIGFLLLAGYGGIALTEAIRSFKWKVIAWFLITLVYGYNIILFSHDYFHHINIHQPLFRNEGQRDLVQAVDFYTNKGFRVVMTSQNANRLIFYLFFNKVDPKYYQSIGSPRDKNGLQFQNLVFDDALCPSNNPVNKNKYPPPVVFVNTGGCSIGSDFITLVTIKRADNSPVFAIVGNAK